MNKCEKEDTLECDKEKRGCDGCYYNIKDEKDNRKSCKNCEYKIICVEECDKTI